MCRVSVNNSNGTDAVFLYPIEIKNAIYNKDLKGIKLLEKAKLVQSIWVENGTNVIFV